MLALLVLSSLIGCDRSDSEPEAAELHLDGAFVGRGVLQDDGLWVVSPFTTAESITRGGFPLQEAVQPLFAEIPPDRWHDLELGTDYRPRVIPRDGVIVLQFNTRLDEGGLGTVRDELGAYPLEPDGPIRVVDARGRDVPARAVVSGRHVFLLPGVVPGGPAAWPASYVQFDAEGNPQVDPTGCVRIVLPNEGERTLRTRSGGRLTSRLDTLGDPEHPIGLNPGNRVLDFVAQNGLEFSDLSFNGFLPDKTPPRILRDYILSGQLSFEDGDASGPTFVFLASHHFSSRARNGDGEWAGGVLTIREGEDDEESRVVVNNDDRKVQVATPFNALPEDGDSWKLERIELFEPDPEDPIDPDHFDPFNPEIEANRYLDNFVFFDEIDENGEISDEDGDGIVRYYLSHLERRTVPSRSVLKIRFDEAMDLASIGPYESLRVLDPNLDEPLPLIGQTRLDDSGTIAALWPERVDQLNPDQTTYPGFGSEETGQRELVVRVVPDIPFLKRRLSSDEILAYRCLGERGLADLAGRPVAFPESLFDPARITLEFRVEFDYRTIPNAPYPDTGVIAHTFQGIPKVQIDERTGNPGARYWDRDTFFGPYPADLNLLAGGVLSGAPALQHRRTVDDQPGNRPPDSEFNGFPFGVGAPLTGYDWHNPFDKFSPIYGARFQHVYRREEASISPEGDLAGTLLDLVRVYFAPIGGEVTPDVYEDVSIHVAHSIVRPITTVSAGIPDDQFSGLSISLDTETYEDGTICPPSVQRYANYAGDLETVVPPGTTWTVDPSNLTSFTGTPHPYLPWPEFTTPFAYDNDRSLVLEYRFRPQVTTVSDRNGMTFSPGIISTPLPRFRVFSYGSSKDAMDPDPENGDLRALCASGPMARPSKFGDNSRYFKTFIYRKTTSRLTSSFTLAHDLPKGSVPAYAPPIFDPPLEDIPPDTSIVLEMRTAADPEDYRDRPDADWVEDVSDLPPLPWLQFRVTLVADPSIGRQPILESLAFPFERITTE